MGKQLPPGPMPVTAARSSKARKYGLNLVLGAVDVYGNSKYIQGKQWFRMVVKPSGLFCFCNFAGNGVLLTIKSAVFPFAL